MMRKLGPISNFSYTLMRQTRTISYGSASNFQERLKVHSQFDPLFLKITENVSVQRQAMAQLKANTTKFVQSTNIGNVINGMKGITGLLCDTSLLDPNSGITFHGKTLKQTLRDLPKLENSKFASPEALYYYLLTKSVPSVEDVKKLSNLILSHYRLPDHTLQVLFDLRKSHPMHQFIAAMASLATESHLASEYVNIPKNEYWKLAYLDSIELLGKAASICGIVSLHAHRLHDAVFTNQDLTPQSNSASAGSASRDLAEYYMSIAAPIGGPEYKGTSIASEFMKLFLTLHADHEGGNISTHSCILVGSALSDPYLSFTAALTGLAGPLHGKANQDVLDFVSLIHKKHAAPSKDDISNFVQSKIDSKQVIPGYGHAVLRVIDPRCEAQLEFAKDNLAQSLGDSRKYLSTSAKMLEIVPPLLANTGKVSNPNPNVDAISGSILHELGFTNQTYFTVLFGLSRAFGCMANYVTNHIYGYPLERPKSTTVDNLLKLID